MSQEDTSLPLALPLSISVPCLWFRVLHAGRVESSRGSWVRSGREETLVAQAAWLTASSSHSLPLPSVASLHVSFCLIGDTRHMGLVAT